MRLRSTPGATPSGWARWARTLVLLAVALLSLTAVQVAPQLRTQRAAAVARLDPTLPPPTGLGTTGLNSTIRANWTPPSDPRVAWQLFTVWDGATLMGEKVLGRTATAADGNGLQPSHPYTVAVQSLSGNGALSNPVKAQAATDRQRPMPNAVFFENFEDSSPGPLDPDYFDVRMDEGETAPQGVGDKLRVFVSEHHFHTMITSGTGDAEIALRPRGIFDFTNRVGTLQFEVDLAGLQGNPGKWLEVHLSRHAPTNSQAFGIATNDAYPDDVSFTFFRPVNARDVDHVQTAAITVNAGGFHQTFTGRSNLFTPRNVRVPVVVKVSRTSAEMLVNGVSVARAGGYTMPFTRGEWTFAHRAFYAPRSPSFPQLLQLLHWQTIQFDGPSGSFSPVRKTYLGPGCPAVKHLFRFDCMVDADQPVDVTVPDQLAGATSARILFNPFGQCERGASTVATTVNGHALNVATQPGPEEHCYDNNLASATIPVSWLRHGGNVIRLGRRADQLEIEVAFNRPRVIGHPAVTPTPLLGVTGDLLLTGRPRKANTVDLTTYLFSQGADTPIHYAVASHTGAKTPWLSIVTPASGTITPIATGGRLVPVTVRVDFTKATDDPGDAVPGIVMVTSQPGARAAHPTGGVLIAVGYDRTAPTYRYAITRFTPLITRFDKAAIPAYHGREPPSPRSQQVSPAALGLAGKTAEAARSGGDGDRQHPPARLAAARRPAWPISLALLAGSVLVVVSAAGLLRARRRSRADASAGTPSA
jgi:hypothetical protein